MKRLVALVAVSLLGATAWAYLPTAVAILKRIGEHRAHIGMRSLRVVGSFTFYGDQAKAVADAMKAPTANAETTVAAEIDYKFSNRCAVTLHAPSGVPADDATASNSFGRIRAVGPDVLPLKIFAKFACPLIDTTDDEHGDVAVVLGRLLEELGGDPSIVSLARFRGKVVYDIGGPLRDVSRPQLWVNKEPDIHEILRVEPARLIGRFESKTYDVQLIDYTSAATGEWHPREVDILEGQSVLAKFIAERVDPNPKLPDSVF